MRMRRAPKPERSPPIVIPMVMSGHVLRRDPVAKDVAAQLRTIADNVERQGLYAGDIQIEDGADFKGGQDDDEDFALRRWTYAVIKLRIKRT